MPKVHCANTQDPDMFYIVRKRIPDPFFYIDTRTERCVFLNALEIDAFNENNTNANLKAVRFQSLIEESKGLQLPGASPMQSIALALFKKYELLEKTVAVSKHFPLDLADFLRAQGAQLMVAD